MFHFRGVAAVSEEQANNSLWLPSPVQILETSRRSKQSTRQKACLGKPAGRGAQERKVG